MEFTNQTSRKEITIAGELLTVIAPFGEGQVLTSAQANVLNQTLAENLRNNFAPRVKEVKESGEEVSLQDELDAYMAEYEFGVRKSGGGSGVSLNPVEKIAVSLARDILKKHIKKAGKDVKEYSTEQFNTLVNAFLTKNPQIIEQARAIYEAKRAAADEVLAGIEL